MILVCILVPAWIVPRFCGELYFQYQKLISLVVKLFYFSGIS